MTSKKHIPLLHLKRSYLLILLMFLFSCNYKYLGSTTVITAYYGKSFLPCDLYSGNQPYSVRHLRKYENGYLREYWGCTDEGFYTTNFTIFEAFPKEDEEVKNLSFECKGKKLTLIGRDYIIDKHVKDSIFTKPDSNNDCIILVRKGI